MFDYFQLSDTKDYQYLLDSIGKDLTLNGTAPIRAIVTNTNLQKIHDDKKISSLSTLHTGDVVDYDSKKWLIISEVNSKRYNKFKGVMRALQHTIIINSSCRFITVNTYIDTEDFSVTSGSVISIANGSIRLNLSDSTIVSGLKLNDKFIVSGQKFKIVGLDRYSNKGLLILSCDKDEISTENDDLIHGIAGGLACPVGITNGTPLSVYVGSTLQLTYTSASSAPVIFTTSDATKATVNASGLVSGISAGSVTITISNASNGYITNTILISVDAVPVTKSIVLTSNVAPVTEIKNSQSKIYTGNVYEGATLSSGNVTWNLYEDDKVTAYNTARAQITATTSTTITIKCLAYTYYVQLKCSLVSDPTVFVWQRIQLKSLV